MKILTKYSGFTLAEVLITLGVIGVVAAMTLPTLIQNYQKQVTINRLKETYSILSQAIKMSELDNGDVSEWNYPEATVQSHIDWINKYLAPYMKNIQIEDGQFESYPRANIKLANGTIVQIWNNRSSTEVHAFVMFSDKPINGKTKFVFKIGTPGKNALFKDKKGIRPYDYTDGYTGNDIRTILKDAPTFGCHKDDSSKMLCTALIMYDGWKIEKDYPW